MDPATNAVDNQGQALAAPYLGKSKVRRASYLRALGNDYWGPKVCEIFLLPTTQPKLLVQKTKGEKQGGEGPAPTEVEDPLAV